MSQEATPGAAEAVPYVRVEFRTLVSRHGTYTVHIADCDTNQEISGLKTDLENMLGLASSRQNWYYRQQLMDNDRNLSSYDILIERRQTYTIDVKDC